MIGANEVVTHVHDGTSAIVDFEPRWVTDGILYCEAGLGVGDERRKAMVHLFHTATRLVEDLSNRIQDMKHLRSLRSIFHLGVPGEAGKCSSALIEETVKGLRRASIETDGEAGGE